MQGIKVSGMLIWSINRVGEGPLNAFKNLGEDIQTENPKSANDTLIAMSSAIVRNCIANSTIDQMMREREKICKAIKAEMFDVVKGWGVWLETVEITDVIIQSQSLFKDLQADHREKMKKEAELYKMIVQQEIDQVKSKEELIMSKKRNERDVEIQIYQKKIDSEIAEETEKQQAQMAIVLNERAKMNNDFNVHKK